MDYHTSVSTIHGKLVTAVHERFDNKVRGCMKLRST